LLALPVALVLQQLEIAGSALEGRETAWAAAPALEPATTIEGSDGC
jgi:hypothetical protein